MNNKRKQNAGGNWGHPRPEAKKLTNNVLKAQAKAEDTTALEEYLETNAESLVEMPDPMKIKCPSFQWYETSGEWALEYLPKAGPWMRLLTLNQPWDNKQWGVHLESLFVFLFDEDATRWSNLNKAKRESLETVAKWCGGLVGTWSAQVIASQKPLRKRKRRPGQ